MATNGTKQYSIVINGLQQSVDAVDSLNKSLDALEKRIDALSKKNINVSTTSSGGGRTKELDAEEKLQKQIIAQEDKIIGARKDEYQILLQQKQEFKELNELQKANVSQARLQDNAYANTMQGLKQKLYDIKAVMQTTDIDSDKFKQLGQDANELNEKLKSIEQSYGQYGRNVGNYANSIAEGMQKYKVEVGGVVREFDSAREASKALSNELLNLPKGAKGAQDLRKALQSVKSDMKDLSTSSKFMDNLLDTMKSFTAIGQVGKGFSALFGFDSDELEKSIQKLVALQNVMQGIEQIQQQMNTGEGIGGWLAKGNQLIDSFVAKLTGASKAQKALNADMKAGKAAAEGLAVGMEAEATATKAATVATKLFSGALKAIGIGLIISAISYLVGNWKDLKKEVTDTVPALKNLEKWFNKIIKVVYGVGAVILNFLLQPLETLILVIQDIINGDFSKAWDDIKSGLKKTFSVAENYKKGYDKAVENENERHNKKLMKQNEERFKDENAQYGESHRRTQEYLRKQLALAKEGSEEYKELQRQLWEDIRREREENQKKAEKAAKEAAQKEKEIAEAQANAIERINNLKIELLNDGLAKELAQLKANNEKEIAEIEKNAKKVGAELTKINKELQEKAYEQSKQKIFENYWEETYQIITDNAIKDFENKIDWIEDELKELSKSRVSLNKAATRDEIFGAIRKSGPMSDRDSQMFSQVWGDSADDLDSSLRERFKRIERYYLEVITDTNDLIREAGIERKKLLDKQYQEEADAIQKELGKIKEEAKESIGVDFDATPGYRKYLETIRDENRGTYTDMEEQAISYVNRMDALYDKLDEINEKYNNDRFKIDVETDERIFNSYQSLYNRELESLNEYFNKAQKLAEEQPVYGVDGFIDISKSKKNYNEALKTIDTILEKIKSAENELFDRKEQGLISPETYTKTVERLYSLEEAAKQTKERVQKNIKQLLPNLLRQIEEVFQILGQAATQVIQSIGEINDAAFERQMEALDKQTEALEDQLEKQKELTQQYADDVNSIEDELANSRGDRRQHLIDQLNAQMQAQRESLAQEKKIEKEQEKLDKKKEELEYQNEMRKWNQSLITAALNAALAISNAAVNNWPIPAIPMIAAATAVGAAQLAAVKANKPRKYADGGLLDGPSHKQGGIRAGNIELEGREYVVNKRTTSKNVDLLDYINSKKKRIDLTDMIDFYAEKPKSIKKISKRYFADGGQIPSLRTDVTLQNNIERAMEAYANRQYVVSVVDIANKSDEVKRVQAIAGLN